MERVITNKALKWLNSSRKALLIEGAKQVGKTYLVKEIAKQYNKNFIEINFHENQEAKELVNIATTSSEILLNLSVLYGDKLVPGETIIFFDEVQECNKLLTAIKFLVEEGSYKYILSGTFVASNIDDIKSLPVGYMEILHMYPMTFYEFCLANGVGKEVFANLYESFKNVTKVQDIIHEKMIKLFHLYLIVGGMPAVVKKYIDTNNLKKVEEEQKSIIELYKKDIAKYDPSEKLYLEDIYDLIPSELNSQNKRFKVADIKQGIKFDRTKDAFLWLVDAGVAIPTYCVNEPKLPLILSKSRNLLKLFSSDVGLLAAMYANNIQLKLLKQEIDINYGGIYENVVAQELKANEIKPFYYKNNKIGELDFVIELDGECEIIEVKSGKNYQQHSALNNLINSKEYNIKNAIVLSNFNVSTKNNIKYLPIYMTMFLKNQEQEEIIYKLDLDELK